MENASKALIIAGAILLAILIISLGLIVYNQAKETVGSVNLSQQEIEAFNAKFTSFEGDKVSGSRVNQLIQTVIASDQQAIDDSTGAYVAIAFPSETSGHWSCLIGVNWFNEPKICYHDGATETNADSVAGSQMREDLKGKGWNTTVSRALRVVPGKNYVVTMAYWKGRIAGIYVK